MTALDTNILLRYVDTADPAHPTADRAVAALAAAGETLVLVPQNLYEFWAAATRPAANNGLGLTVAECQAEIAGLKAQFQLLLDEPTLYDEWEALVVAHACRGKVAHDARIVAALRTHGVARLLTFNVADFARYPGPTVLDPAAVAAPGSAAGS